jgi:prepilin-type processing-associated H-X9-DG protein
MPLTDPENGVGGTAREAEEGRHRTRGCYRWIIGGMVSFALLMTVFVLITIHQHRLANGMQAINNIRQIWESLLEFEQHYGRFPDESTAAAVRSKTGTALTLGSGSSNELFRQLLVGTGIKLEKPFWAAAEGSIKVDDIYHTDSHALAAGECGFAYVAGLSSSDPGHTPLVMSPMIPGTLRFDRQPFAGRAVVLFVDGSVKTMPIDKQGQLITGGMDLFDPRQPFWKGKAPDIKWAP